MTHPSGHDDFAFEPIPGLPEVPPHGERILWQGAPDPLRFAVEVMRLKLVAAVVVGLAGWRVAAGIEDGLGLRAVLATAAGTLMFGAIVFALLWIAGHLMARGTIYTITTQRLVIRHGVAMPMAINIPFARIVDAAVSMPADNALARQLDGTTIALTSMPGARASFIALWPHVRPLKLRWPQPALRGLADGAHVAEILAKALAESTGGTARVPARSRAMPELEKRPVEVGTPSGAHIAGAG